MILQRSLEQLDDLLMNQVQVLLPEGAPRALAQRAFSAVILDLLQTRLLAFYQTCRFPALFRTGKAAVQLAMWSQARLTRHVAEMAVQKAEKARMGVVGHIVYIPASVVRRGHIVYITRSVIATPHALEMLFRVGRGVDSARMG